MMLDHKPQKQNIEKVSLQLTVINQANAHLYCLMGEQQNIPGVMKCREYLLHFMCLICLCSECLQIC